MLDLNEDTGGLLNEDTGGLLNEDTGGLYQVEAPHFSCGFTVKMGLVIASAPIVRYMIGWTVAKAKGYCAAKKWKISYLGV